MNTQNENKPQGRPFKMQVWVNELTNVLATEEILFLSDKDLLFLVNRNLLPEHQICKSTFEKWKAGKFHINDTIGKEFIGCIELALIRQKQLLSKKMMDDTTGQWTRYAWIMERKFVEWNLKHISENINRNETETVINITAGNDAQKKIIDSLINTEFIEVKPERLSMNDNDIDTELPF